MQSNDDRFYAFIVGCTSRSRAWMREVAIHRRWLPVLSFAGVLVAVTVLYGLYGLTQQAAHLRAERENVRLRSEQAKTAAQLRDLNDRIAAVEDASRRIAQMSGIEDLAGLRVYGAGGPGVWVRPDDIVEVESKTADVERRLIEFEALVRKQAVRPSLWPVRGELRDGFGNRRNPFGGRSLEFHEGQDIDAEWGAPVAVTANGVASFAGWQNGYGQVVIVDHGSGLTSRYAHLSRVEVSAGQSLTRGSIVGRVGSTGRSTGPHLHYEVRMLDQPVDPRPYLPAVIY